MLRQSLLLLSFISLSTQGATVPAFEKQFWSLFGFTLNVSSIADVQRVLGPATAFAVPDEHHEQALCYHTKDGSSVVVFSTGEMGGGKELLGVSLEHSTLHNYACATPKAPLVPALPLGIRIGMDATQLKSLVGAPPEITNPELYEWRASYERPVTRDEVLKSEGPGEHIDMIMERGVADVSQYTWARVKDGKVIGFGVWKEETF